MHLKKTPHGSIPIRGPVERYLDGSLRSCTVADRMAMKTPLGSLIPQYSTDDLRRKTVQAVSFHDNGMIHSLPLEERTVVETPAGPVLSEMVTFHPCGALNRVFPLNGRLCGYWTQDDEAALAHPVRLRTPLGLIEVRIICVRFDEEGHMLGLTLWPGETLRVPTPVGMVETRIGIRFSPQGRVLSLEPAEPVIVQTPIGDIRAFDPDAVGISGDVNSLAFDEYGTVCKVRTVQSSVVAMNAEGGSRIIAPDTRESLCGDEDVEVVPMTLEFEDGFVTLTGSSVLGPVRLPLEGTQFSTSAYQPLFGISVPRLRCSV